MKVSGPKRLGSLMCGQREETLSSKHVEASALVFND